MTVHANTTVTAADADDVRVRTHGDIHRVTFGVGELQHVVRLHPRAAEALYMQLGAALHGADEPAREAAYQEQQVKDAVENGLGMDAQGWVFNDYERRVVRDPGTTS